MQILHSTMQKNKCILQCNARHGLYAPLSRSRLINSKHLAKFTKCVYVCVYHKANRFNYAQQGHIANVTVHNSHYVVQLVNCRCNWRHLIHNRNVSCVNGLMRTTQSTCCYASYTTTLQHNGLLHPSIFVSAKSLKCGHNCNIVIKGSTCVYFHFSISLPQHLFGHIIRIQLYFILDNVAL